MFVDLSQEVLVLLGRECSLWWLCILHRLPAFAKHHQHPEAISEFHLVGFSNTVHFGLHKKRGWTKNQLSLTKHSSAESTEESIAPFFFQKHPPVAKVLTRSHQF